MSLHHSVLHQLIRSHLFANTITHAIWCSECQLFLICLQGNNADHSSLTNITGKVATQLDGDLNLKPWLKGDPKSETLAKWWP